MRRLAASLGLAAVAALAFASTTAAGTRTVHIRGTAYDFTTTSVLLAGATVRVAENPRLRAITRRDGTYDLVVPAHARVTPFITVPGYHTIYLQTFRTDGENLDRVNFQTPTETVYRLLAAVLAVPLGPGGQLRDCAIVTTFSTRNVRDLSFRQFTAYGAHGVAGATAFGTPALPRPTYFNASVVPDQALKSSSADGGVVWTRVPRGVYTIRARDPSTRFASFVATCVPGRVVNANPPWGLHELGLAMPASVSARWSVSGATSRLTGLSVARVPSGSTVRIRCSGPGCPFRRRTVAGTSRASLDLLAVIGRTARTFHAGQSVAVLVSAHAHNGKLVSWRLRTARTPKAVTRCIPLGNTKPQARC